MPAIDVIALPGRPGMFARRVAVQAWQTAGSPPVNSAGRLYAEQKRMYDGWRRRLPGFNPADNPDDETQRLAHVRFVAFDIDPTADGIRRLTAAGFIRPYTYEPWHWELPNVRSYAIVRSIPATASLIGEKIMALDDTDKTFLNGLGQSIIEQITGGGAYGDTAKNPYTVKQVRADIGYRDQVLAAIQETVTAIGPTTGGTVDLGPILAAIQALPAATVAAIKNAL